MKSEKFATGVTTVNYQLSTINCQLSTINCQLNKDGCKGTRILTDGQGA
jgi:hypothetical protein